MREDRFRNLEKVLPGRKIGLGKDDINGIYNSRYEEEPTQYAMMQIQRGSPEAERLEKAGYVLVYPKIADYPKDGIEVNEYLNQNDAMILDKVSKNPNVDVIHSIAMHYNKEDRPDLALQEKDGSLTFAADEGLKKIYDEIGIEYEEKENGDITVRSDVKMKEIPKSKMAQIYDKAKGKIKGAFNNLKNFFKGKDQNKTLEEGKQEQDDNSER